MKRSEPGSVDQYWGWFEALDSEKHRKDLIRYELELRKKFRCPLNPAELKQRFSEHDLEHVDLDSINASYAQQTMIASEDESVKTDASVGLWRVSQRYTFHC